MTINETPSVSVEKPQASRIGFDSLLEDMFGLNIRGLKSIATTFTKPAEYYRAADHPDWLDRYTPSFRVWFGLLALYSVLRFIYGAEDSPMVEIYTGVFEEAMAAENEPRARLNATQAAQETLKWTFVFFPFALLPFYALLAWIFRAFGHATTFVQRLRYIFATILPSTLLVLLSTFLLILPLTAQHLFFVSIGSFAMILIADGTTAYRGAFSRADDKNRAGLSIVFTLLLFVSYFGASMLAAVPAMSIAVANSLEKVETPSEIGAYEDDLGP